MAEEIANLYQIPVIFITAYADKEMVEAALKTKCAAYITKPFKQIDIYAAISIIMKAHEENPDKYFVFKDGYSTIRLMHNEILYVESQGNYVTIVTINKKYVIRQSLDWCAEHLPPEQFARIHRSYIVNQEKIEKITTHHVCIKANLLPISRAGRKNIQQCHWDK
jgi:DNA-binding LytR/AlgR family response regulator